MLKKAFLILATLSFIFCFSTLSLAAHVPNSTRDTMRNAGNTVGGAIDGIKNATGNVGNSISNTMHHDASLHGTTGTDTRNAGTHTGTHTGTTTGYNATRTAAPDHMNRTTTTWSWIIVGATVLIIGGLIWYYVSDANRSKLRDER